MQNIVRRFLRGDNVMIWFKKRSNAKTTQNNCLKPFVESFYNQQSKNVSHSIDSDFLQFLTPELYVVIEREIKTINIKCYRV